jgi:hypothetical protein
MLIAAFDVVSPCQEQKVQRQQREFSRSTPHRVGAKRKNEVGVVCWVREGSGSWSNELDIRPRHYTPRMVFGGDCTNGDHKQLGSQ